MQSKKSKKKKSPLIPTLIIIVLIVIGIVLLVKGMKKSNFDGNSCIGTFYYQEGDTKYTFNEDGTGKMSGKSFKYEYNYEVDGKTLKLDFKDKEVHDAVYSYELKDGILKLISKEGTVSLDKEYILKKENK